jgi:predicted ATP-grasp superfamily ATP-dependent carboligase
MFTAYIVAWAGHNIGSKLVAMKRDQPASTRTEAPPMVSKLWTLVKPLLPGWLLSR